MHEREAAAHGIRCDYCLIDLDEGGRGPSALPTLIDAAEREGFAGLNITHPCKQQVMDLLTEVSEDAREVGAVNTVVLRDGRRIGHNTDWTGFAQSVRTGLPGADVAHVVQLGAGGAGAATAYAMRKLGVERLTIIDVDPSRAEALARRMGLRWSDDIAGSLASASGLIHATPTGMASHPGLPLDATLLRSQLWLAEIVYFPLETALLTAARATGCRVLDGSGMAVGQAVDAFRLFTGLEADRERMRRYFLEADLS